MNEYVTINGDLTLDGNVVVPHGIRVKVVGLVPRPTSSVGDYYSSFGTDLKTYGAYYYTQDRSWAQTEEDTMYLIAYATTLTSRTTFPVVRNNAVFEPSLRVSTAKFVLAATSMAKPGGYDVDDIVSAVTYVLTFEHH